MAPFGESKRRIEFLIQTDPIWMRYGVAVGVTTLASLFTYFTSPWIEPTPFLILLAGAMISALYGGVGPGLSALFLSLFTALFVQPGGRFVVESEGVLRAGLFLLMGFMITCVTASFRSAYRRAERARETLEKQAEVLRENAELLDLANILVRDIENRIILWNKGAERMYGWKKEEALGKISHQLLQTHFPQPLEQIEETLRQRGQWEGELEHRRRDGTVVFVASLWVLHRDAAGGAEAILEVNNDVTERRRIEEVLRRKTVEAEEANRAKSRLVSSVSHDLRSPLNSIIGYASLLRDETFGPLVEDQKPPLDGIQKNAEDLLKLIEQVLDLARLEAGKLQVEIAPVDVTPLLTGLCAEMRPLADQKSLALGCVIPVGLPTIESDPMKLKQIVSNLLSNAIKFTERGEVRISVRNLLEQQGIQIEVRDTGPGIKPEALPRIFEGFYRAEETRGVGGTGLGLSIVKELVHLLHGEIGFESALGKGSTFVIFLPYQFEKSN